MKSWVKSHKEDIHKWAYDAYRKVAKSGDKGAILQAIEDDVNAGLAVMRSAWGLSDDDRLYFYWCDRLNKHFHVFDKPIDQDVNEACVYCSAQEREKKNETESMHNRSRGYK